MRLENKKQPIVPVKTFAIRLLKYALFTIALIFISLSIGTFGYYFSANLSMLDSFYMSSMILTGMGPTAEMTAASAKLFSSFYALYSGVAFLSITAVFFAPIVHRVLHILQIESDKD